MRGRLLPNQPIWDINGTLFADDTSTLNTQMERKLRDDNPADTIFAIDELVITYSKKRDGSQGSPFVTLVEGAETCILTGPNANASAAIQKAFDLYQSGKPAVLKELEKKKEKAAEESKKPETGSLLATLLAKYPKPTPAVDGFYVPDSVWRIIIRNMYKNQPTLITGPAGTGKTELVKLLAERFGKPMKKHDFGAMQDSISGLLGVHRLDKKGSQFDRAQFSFDIESANCILIDEINRAPQGTTNILFPVLDSSKVLQLSVASSSEAREIAVHPDCFFIATANEGISYTGTNTIDQALKERFQVIEMDYMPESEEVAVLEKRTGIDTGKAERIVSIATMIRRAEEEGELSIAVSTRHTLRVSELVVDGFTLREACEAIFIPMYNREERGQIKDILASL